MRTIAQAYTALLKESSLENKHVLQALQITAETNDHHAIEIADSIQQEAKTAESPRKESLEALLKALSQHHAYSFLAKKSRKRSAPEPEPIKQAKIDPVISKSPSPPSPSLVTPLSPPAAKPVSSNLPSFGSLLLPYPPEFFLFKLVDKKTYLESYQYYTASKEEDSHHDQLPTLERSYLNVPRLALAQKFLYSTIAQCKVCGMRFDSLEPYTAHADAHQRKSQIDKSLSGGAIWRPWLLEINQWAGEKPQHFPKVSLKESHQDQVDNVPVKGDRDQICTICKDPLEVIWSDNDECWAFKDAILVSSQPTRQICHRKCVS
ncbi:hypothetical protein NEHOM01_1769 [Nematocida homosporus]|uniref:uncharacterized protein n=1 Tax=Nematocida homosporus TaxID=1912981 RepID=UPI00221FA1AA|nr:uncharacterized protein NEHOM01_1769 [Nematocida homosporus]KAI5186880.1 hypothetical protein NEHOM01_1769 [Nematocida homosporus]